MRVAHEGDGVGDGVECPGQAVARGRGLRRTTPRASGGGYPVGGPGEVEQVGALGVVELQCSGERFEDRRRRAGDGAPFQAGVVLDAHPGEGRDLAASKTGHAATTAGREPCGLGRDLRASRHQEFADLGSVVHTPSVGRSEACRGALSVHLPTGTVAHATYAVALMGDRICRRARLVRRAGGGTD